MPLSLISSAIVAVLLGIAGMARAEDQPETAPDPHPAGANQPAGPEKSRTGPESLAPHLPAPEPPAKSPPPGSGRDEPGRTEPAAGPATESAQRAAVRLQALVTRGDALLTQLAQEGADEANCKRELQGIIFDFEDFLRACPKDAMGHTAFGRLLGKVGMRRESVAMLLKANQLDPDIPFVKNQLGNYLAEEGKALEAVNYFLAAIRLAPREALYHYQLGTLLHEARDDFLKSGDWKRAALDQAMHDAFRRAADLAPDNFAFAYRYAESFYDIDPPHWDEALKVWGELEDRCAPGLEKETVRLHAANILLKQGRIDHARLLLNAVSDEKLAAQKQKLLDQLPAAPEK